MIESYQDLIVWQRSMDVVQDTYRLANQFPETERYGLWSQITRAAISIPANIAEGSRRGSRREYAQFVSVARGSLAEVETFLLIAVRLDYIVDEQAAPVMADLAEISRMLSGLRNSLLR